METLLALLALCEGTPPIIGEGPVITDLKFFLCFVFFLNKLLNTVQLLLISDAMTLMWCLSNVLYVYCFCFSEEVLWTQAWAKAMDHMVSETQFSLNQDGHNIANDNSTKGHFLEKKLLYL